MSSELNRADASRYLSSGRVSPGYPPMGDLMLPQSSRKLGEALAGFADQRDRLGEQQPDRVSHLHRLLVRIAAQLQPADRCHGHTDRQVDRLIRECHLLLLLGLFHETGQLPLDLLGVTTAEHGKREVAHSWDDTA